MGQLNENFSLFGNSIEHRINYHSYFTVTFPEPNASTNPEILSILPILV